MYIGTRSLLAPFRRTSIGMPATVAAPLQAETTAWVAAVVTNGGTVSAGRQTIVNNFIYAEKTAGTWALTDDYWGLWAENAPQALTSLKQLRLTTAVAAPTFTADRNYVFNGTTQYLNTGFIPVTHGSAMTGTNMRLAAYERTNVAASFTCGAHFSTTAACNLSALAAGNVMTASLNQSTVSLTPVTTSAGFTAMSRAGGGTTVNGYRNGVALAPVVGGAPGVSLPNIAMYVACRNNAGTAANFGARSIAFLCAGAPLSAGQETAQYNNVLAWATAIGANV